MLSLSRASSKAKTSIFSILSSLFAKKSSGAVSLGWSILIAIIAAIVDVTSSGFLSLYFLKEIIFDAELLISDVSFVNYAPLRILLNL